jgi:NTE family protein
MKQKVALVLGSGGARGITHIGVIRELINQGYKISSISGTSMGALVGGIYACGKLEEYESWLLTLSKMDVFNLIDFTLSTRGIIKADRVFKEMQKFIPDHKIEDLPIKFAAVTADLKQKKEVVLTQGSLFDALRKSISIPLLITPVLKNDSLFVDGGILNPLPVNRVFRHTNDILIAVDLNASVPYQKPQAKNHESRFLEKITNGKLSEFHKKISKLFPATKKESIGYFNLIGDTTDIMLSQISKLTLQLTPPDILIEISKQTCGTFEFYRAAELIELGRKTTIEVLEGLKKQKQQIPIGDKEP